MVTVPRFHEHPRSGAGILGMSGVRPLSSRLLVQANLADGIILLPFAVPFMAQYYLRLWSWLNLSLGGASFPDFTSTHLVFVNLVGAFAVLAVVFRARQDTIQTAQTVGIFKLLVATIFGLAVAGGAARVFVIPMLADLIVGSLLCFSARSERSVKHI